MNAGYTSKKEKLGNDSGWPRFRGSLQSRLTLLFGISFLFMFIVFFLAFLFINGKIKDVITEIEREQYTARIGDEISMILMRQVSKAMNTLGFEGLSLYDGFERDNRMIRDRIRAFQRLELNKTERLKVEEIKVKHQDVVAMIQYAMTCKKRNEHEKMQAEAAKLIILTDELSSMVMDLSRLNQERTQSSLLEIEGKVTNTLTFVIICGFISLFLFSLLCFAVIRKLLAPLNELITATASVGKGEFDVRISRGTTVETNRISGAFNLMTKALFETETERKKMEARILEEKQFSENLFENAYEAIFISDIKTDQIIRVNRQCKVLTGMNRETLLGMQMKDLVPKKEWEMLAARRAQVIAQGRSFFSETHLLIENDEIIDVERSETRIHYQDRQVIQSMIRNVTETRRLQQQLIQAQKMESVGNLAAGIAHEFNNLLCGILGNVSFVQMNVDPDSPAQKEMETIKGSALKAAELTHRLMAFTRAGQSRISSMDLNVVVRETVRLLSRNPNKNIRIDLRTADGVLPVKGDRNQLEQVFMNISLNACEAMPSGGNLTITTRLLVLSEGKEREDFIIAPGHYAVVEVTDTGIGMERDTLKMVFEPFFSTKKKGFGTGLGMPMSFGIVKNHRGYLDLESRTGVGTTVTVYLPLDRTEKIKKRVGEEAEAVVTSTGAILVVDDEDVIRDLCRRILTRDGYQVHLAADGEEAVTLFQTHMHEIALVILDIIMPGLDGGEVFRRISAIKPDIRVIVLTGFGPSEITHRILSEGPHHFISKPFLPEDLLNAVRKNISVSESQ